MYRDCKYFHGLFIRIVNDRISYTVSERCVDDVGIFFEVIGSD